jgi:uncharacterized membrane protein HdeD (DUF308 family)
MSLRRLIITLCVGAATVVPAYSRAEAEGSTAGAASVPDAAASAPVLKIRAATVDDGKPWCHYLFFLSCPGRNATLLASKNGPDGKDATSMAPSPNASTQLIGSGDLDVYITRDSFEEAGAYVDKSAKTLHLFINGVDLGSDAILMSTELLDKDADTVRLHYHIGPGPNTQKVWATLYRTVGLTRTDKLRVALGWDTIGPRSQQEGIGQAANTVAVTTPTAKAFAILLVIAIFVAFLWMARRTDILRDKSFPGWWKVADGFRRQLLNPPNSAKQASFIKTRYAFYDPEKNDDYKNIAQAALNAARAGNYDVVSTTDEPSAIVGAALLGATWSAPNPLPATYSLARTQVAAWFLFAVASAIFLWVVYGQLAPLDGSVLVLLGISTATAGAGMAADPEVSPFMPSQGFFTDLLTDSTNRYQLHRLQCVIVNIMLLIVGIRHVADQLTYPVFDTTWLAFLGISGAAYAAGKQFGEPKSGS